MFRKLQLNLLPTLKSNILQLHSSQTLTGNAPKRFFALKKRFYRKTDVLHSNGKYEVTLDHRKLKTPGGKTFYVESEPLALAVAAEWDAQRETIAQSTMHLTALCNTVIDNPNNLTKDGIVGDLIRYLESDTILFLTEGEDELYSFQQAIWGPVVDWFCQRFNVKISTTTDIGGPVITPETKQIVSKYLLSYNIWAIHGFKFAIEALKSTILGISCAERHLSVERAVLLARLEEDFQAKRWGRVEWAHELNQQDLQARVAASIMFIYFNSSSSMIKSKAEVV